MRLTISGIYSRSKHEIMPYLLRAFRKTTLEFTFPIESDGSDAKIGWLDLGIHLMMLSIHNALDSLVGWILSFFRLNSIPCDRKNEPFLHVDSSMSLIPVSSFQFGGPIHTYGVSPNLSNIFFTYGNRVEGFLKYTSLLPNDMKI